ncbi:hypothetical protein EYR40_004600 [Pleurotus pulmonarius]|nr:hypothetical protein EYR38_001831 [Pleurotus pulmonarius]KAF4605810.1 hypothetical protein EYR40_004600 [Pleurotus pulmonarius]
MSTDNSYTNNLQPPVGTSYDAKETITIFSDQVLSFYDQEGGGARNTEKLTWIVDLYKYVTGAKPTEEDFGQKGGEIYIVMVHRGTGNNMDRARLHQFGYRVTVPSALNAIVHYPATGTGTQDGLNWDYTISFNQRMSMFNNGGNSAFDFNAEYQETFTRQYALQDGSVSTTGAEFSWEFQTSPGFNFSFPMKGLTVFKTTDPTIFPVTMKFDAWVYERLNRRPGYERYVGNASNSVSVDFKFTA